MSTVRCSPDYTFDEEAATAVQTSRIQGRSDFFSPKIMPPIPVAASVVARIDEHPRVRVYRLAGFVEIRRGDILEVGRNQKITLLLRYVCETNEQGLVFHKSHYWRRFEERV